jgi:hypothetical protein
METTMKKSILVLVTSLFFAAGAWAGVTVCANSTSLPTDGSRIVNDSVATNSTNYYFAHVLQGHSYSIEAVNNFTSYTGVTLQLSLLNNSCGATTQTFTDVTAIEPAIDGTDSTRISFIAQANAYLTVSLTNPNLSSGVTYTISAIDSTLHNTRWSTFSGFITQYAFRNTSNSTINATLVVTTTLGGVVAPVTLAFTVPANSEVFKIVASSGGDANVTANHAGFATLSYVGPAGSIKADAYFINPSATVIVPNPFEARSFQH